MADSKRQQIVGALITRLKLISVPNGYDTALGNRVYEWRLDPLGGDEFPAIIVKDTGEEIDDTANMGKHAHALTVELHCLCLGSTAPAAMRKFVGDVYKSIGTDITFGGLAVLTHPVTDKTEMEQGDKLFSATVITVTILYRTAAWNPNQ